MLSKSKLRLFSMLLFLCVVFTMNTMAEPIPSILAGDLNRDGRVTAADALLILQQSVGLLDRLPYDPEGDFLADLNFDQELNASDALLALQQSVGLTPAFSTELDFSFQTVQLSYRSYSGASTPEILLAHSDWRRFIDTLCWENGLTDAAVADIAALYDAEFFKESVLLAGIDSLPSAADISVNGVTLAGHRLAVTLYDGASSEKEAGRHLILVALSRADLEQADFSFDAKKTVVFFERTDTLPLTQGCATQYFYGPHDAFDHTALYTLDSLEDLQDYARTAWKMISDEQADTDYPDGFRQGYQHLLLGRNQENYFEQYRTLVFEEHGYTRSSSRYEYSLENNPDGSCTLVLTLADDNPPVESESPEDQMLDGFLTMRMTLIDLPVDTNALPITQVCSADGRILWEKSAE